MNLAADWLGLPEAGSPFHGVPPASAQEAKAARHRIRRIADSRLLSLRDTSEGELTTRAEGGGMGQRVVLDDSGATPDLADGSILFIGTATVLIRYAGFTILTDPNFLHRGERVYLGYGLRSRRLTNPAMDLEALPPLDCVLLSHLHEDHFDRLVHERLDRGLPILSTPKAARTLSRDGFRHTVGMPTWDSTVLARDGVSLRVTAMPGRHGPAVLHRLLPPVMGSMLEFYSERTGTAGDPSRAGDGTGQPLMRLYITGDTLMHHELATIPSRYPFIDLALIHLGGTRAFGILVTMDGTQGLQLLQLIAPTTALPIHYNDYTVFKSPLEEFQREVKAVGLDHRVHYLRHGDRYAFHVPENRRSVLRYAD